jgi:hypothetical protein
MQPSLERVIFAETAMHRESRIGTLECHSMNETRNWLKYLLWRALVLLPPLPYMYWISGFIRTDVEKCVLYWDLKIYKTLIPVPVQPLILWLPIIYSCTRLDIN